MEEQEQQQQQEQEPVTSQPAKEEPVQFPPKAAEADPPGYAPAGTPVGLEYLAQLDKLFVHQKVERNDLASTKFNIMDTSQKPAFEAAESSSFISRLCCFGFRGFTYRVTDTTGQEVFKVRREFSCCKGCPWGCCDCCNYMASVSDRSGQVLGYVSTRCFVCAPGFHLYDAQMNVTDDVRLPCFPYQSACCTGDVVYPVIALGTDSQIATVTKTRCSVKKSTFSNADNYTVVFPQSLDPAKKAVILGAVLVANIMIFENQPSF